MAQFGFVLSFFSNKALFCLCTKCYFTKSCQSGFVTKLISCKGFVQNGKFKMFRHKQMHCSFYDQRLTSLVFCQKQNKTITRSKQLKITPNYSNYFQNAPNYSKLLQINPNRFKWLKWFRMAPNGCKWLKMAPDG